MTTVSKILREEILMTKGNIRWILKFLDVTQKLKRVRIAAQMLKVLSDHEELKYVFTQDETWIYLENPRKMMCVMCGSARPQGHKRMMVRGK